MSGPINITEDGVLQLLSGQWLRINLESQVGALELGLRKSRELVDTHIVSSGRVRVVLIDLLEVAAENGLPIGIFSCELIIDAILQLPFVEVAGLDSLSGQQPSQYGKSHRNRKKPLDHVRMVKNVLLAAYPYSP